MIATDQMIAAPIGCSSVHGWWAGVMVEALPNNWRIEATTGVSGFQLAIGRSQSGNPCSEAKVLARKLSGIVSDIIT